MTQRRAALWGMAIFGAVFVGTACGTRVERAAESPVPVTAAATLPSSVSSPTMARAGSTETRAAGAVESPVRAGDGAQVSAARQSPPPSPAAPAQAGTAGRSEPKATPSHAQSPEPPGNSAVPATPGQSSREGTRSPVLFASVGSYSGVVGAIISPFLQGAQLWVRYINHAGGVNGHLVNFIAYDDGGDPARHRAQVQDAVEQRKAIAFLMNGESVTGEGSVQYINAKRVPIVGLVAGETWAASSPMYFPQASVGDPWNTATFAAVAQQAIARGKTKLASLICVEASACDRLDAVVAKAKDYGLELVYHGRASLAQPDFTAECLSARNASAEVFFAAMDQNSITRIATACARQGYRPTYAIHVASINERQTKDANFQGMIASTTVAPYFETNTPATAEYHQALRTLSKGEIDAPASVIAGWTAGKLMEKAMAQLPEPPTTAGLLSGLWSIKGEDRKSVV